MNDINLQKALYSAAIFFVLQLVAYFLKRSAKSTQKRLKIRQSRYFAVKRLISIIALILTLVILILIWDVSIKSVWVSLSGILALVAIAFFAVWSLIGNILAGVIIYFTSPFKIDDEIEIIPDEVRGCVLAVNTFYTVLLTNDDNYINIPNSLLFQRYIRVIKKKKPPSPPSAKID